MVTRFAGQFNAVAFAYGLSSPGVPGPLVVNVGNAAAGVVSLQLDYGYVVTEDGIKFNPLATTAPVIFGVGANAETLTPSAVGGVAEIYGSQTVTANFANTHGQGDLLSTGTVGLQEAINYAASLGGGTVIVGSRWTQLGGTNAMLAAATVPSTVNIEDQRAGAGVQENVATVALTNTNLLAMNATPITIVPAQGTGTLIEVVSMVLDVKWVTDGAFAGGSALGLKYGAGGTAAAATVAATVLTTISAPQSILVAGALAVTANSSILNKDLVLQAATSEFTNAGAGRSTAIAKVTYRVHRGL